MCILENGKTEVDCIDEGIRFEAAIISTIGNAKPLLPMR
jgi:hypothetical protein